MTIKTFDMLSIEPSFDLRETMGMNLTDIKVGQRIQVILNYRVIEETKSFRTLKVTGVTLHNSKRIL